MKALRGRVSTAAQTAIALVAAGLMILFWVAVVQVGSDPQLDPYDGQAPARPHESNEAIRLIPGADPPAAPAFARRSNSTGPGQLERPGRSVATVGAPEGDRSSVPMTENDRPPEASLQTLVAGISGPLAPNDLGGSASSTPEPGIREPEPSGEYPAPRPNDEPAAPDESKSKRGKPAKTEKMEKPLGKPVKPPGKPAKPAKAKTAEGEMGPKPGKPTESGKPPKPNKSGSTPGPATPATPAEPAEPAGPGSTPATPAKPAEPAEPGSTPEKKEKGESGKHGSDGRPGKP